MPRRTKHQKRRYSRKQNLLKKRRQTARKKKGSQNRTKRGGKQYGKGAKGTLFDIFYTEKPDDKLKLIEMIGKNTSNITLYKYNGNTGDITNSTTTIEEEPGQENTKEIKIDKNEYSNIKISYIDFSNWLELDENKNRLAKVFTEENAFFDELKENSNVFYNTLNRDPNNISTLEPNYKIGDGSIEFSGVKIELEDKTKKYALFTKKCIPYPYYILTDIDVNDDNKIFEDDKKTYHRVNMKKFMIEILDAINKINTDKFYHNDIKISNIVYDNNNNKMKLIDWGAGKTIPDDYKNGGLAQCVYRGDPIFSSLYKMYIRYTTPGDGVSTFMSNRNKYNPSLISIIPLKILQYDTTNIRGKAKPDLSYYYAPDSKSSSQILAKQSIKNFYDYQSKTFRRIIADLETSKNKNYDEIKKTLFEKYRKSFDLHMFGMTIFHAVYIFDLDVKWIDEYAIPFTNLDPESPHKEYLTNPFGKMEELINKINSFSKTQSVSSKGVWISPMVYKPPN